MVDEQPPSVRDQVLHVATKLFARHGFSGTSLQSIVDEVGIRKPSLLHHFRSKDLLRLAVLDGLFGHWTERIPGLLQAFGGGRARFEALMQELLRFFLEDPDRARLIVRELMDRPEDMRARLRKTLEPWIQLLGDSIRQSQQAGQLRSDVDPESYLVHMVTMTISAAAAMPVLTDALPGDESSAGERHAAELLRIARSSIFVREADPGR